MKQKLCAVIYGRQKIVYVILIKFHLLLTLRALILQNRPSGNGSFNICFIEEF